MSEPAVVLSQLARAFAATAGDPRPLPLRMCQACVTILGADGGSISVRYGDDRRVSLGATDEFVAGLDDLQEVISEGPMHLAYAEERIVRARVDGDVDQRWPLFSDTVARTLGPCTLYAVPIRPGRTVIGVGTFYQRGVFATEPALAVDDDSTVLLVNAVGVALIDDISRSPILSTAAEHWGDRSKINQATGMVMAQLRLSPEDALALLRAHAFAHDTTLVGISRQLLSRELDFKNVDREAEEDR